MTHEASVVILYFNRREIVGDEEAAAEAFVHHMKDFDISEKDSRSLIAQCPDIVVKMIESLNQFK